ncbi:MAG TPA: VOC family protein [Acidobacteriaceae bacterium]|jgi:predicted 3-demethylubiquinone-9 3-methyltransferase (glyoxalase superfamily)|nr:VOC family protein [Acidobacteriaceae bacterium]
MMPKIMPFLWFDRNAEEAVEFYLNIFPNSRKVDELRTTEAGPGPRDSVLTIEFELDGQRFIALNGGPDHAFNEAVSFYIPCKDQAEIDSYWSKLLEGGGSPIACGWLKDRFGLRWQVVPENVGKLLRHPEAMRVMMTMTKMDLAALEAAAGKQD